MDIQMRCDRCGQVGDFVSKTGNFDAIGWLATLLLGSANGTHDGCGGKVYVLVPPIPGDARSRNRSAKQRRSERRAARVTLR